MRRQLRRCRFSGSLRIAAAIVRDVLVDTRTSHVRAPPHPRHFVPICSFGRPRSSSRAVFFRLFRRHRCLALGSNGLWQLDVPPRMHPSAVTAQALVQQTSFRTPRFSCWCAGSSAGAHSRCSGAQSRPPCGLRRSCSDLVSIARPNRTITSCVQAAPVGSSHGFDFASGHLFSWPSQDDNRGRVDGTTAAHAPAAPQVPILAAVCSLRTVTACVQAGQPAPDVQQRPGLSCSYQTDRIESPAQETPQQVHARWERRHRPFLTSYRACSCDRGCSCAARRDREPTCRA